MMFSSRIILSLMIFSVISSQARAEATVTVKWDYVSSEIAPLQQKQSHRNDMTLFLNGRNVRLANVTNRPSARFGQKMSGENGQKETFGAQFNIVKGKIVGNVRFGGSNIIVYISTDGVSSCDAEISYSKVAGFADYWGTDVNGVKHTFSDMHAENVKCVIR